MTEFHCSYLCGKPFSYILMEKFKANNSTHCKSVHLHFTRLLHTTELILHKSEIECIDINCMAT